jgi:hypothetical protein
MSYNDKKIDELVNKINNLTEDFNKFKSTIDDIIIMNTTLVQEIANQINTKIDILCNLESSSAPNAKTASKRTKALSKPAFFKDKLKLNMNEFINVLYTEEEINELQNNSDVKNKKTELQKKNKLIDILYSNITKDTDKNKKLKDLFDEYKKQNDNIYNDEEETKEE